MSILTDLIDGQYVRRFIHVLDAQGHVTDAVQFIGWMEQAGISPESVASDCRKVASYHDGDEPQIAAANSFLTGFLMGMSRAANRKGRK